MTTESDICEGEMRTIDIHEAKTHLFQLVEQAARGESFLIAISGRPRVMVVPLNSEAGHVRRIGFLDGAVCVPVDFDHGGHATIERLLGGS